MLCSAWYGRGREVPRFTIEYAAAPTTPTKIMCRTGCAASAP